MTLWLQSRKADCMSQGWDRLRVSWASWQWENNTWLVCNFMASNFLGFFWSISSIQLSCMPLFCRRRCMYSELLSAMELPCCESVVDVNKPICSVADLLERCYIRFFSGKCHYWFSGRDQLILRLEWLEKSDLCLKLAPLGAAGWTRWPPEVPSNLNYSMILWKVPRSAQGHYPLKPPSGHVLILDCMGHQPLPC